MKIQDNLVLSGTIKDDSFVQHDSLGKGFGVYTDEDGNRVVETDVVVARLGARLKELKVYQTEYMGGDFIISSACLTVSEVTQGDGYFRCFFDTKGGSVSNGFREGDGAFCQRYGDNDYKYYWMRVVSVGTDYIDLSMEDRDTGDYLPAAGDVIIQLGNTEDKSRQGAILISTRGDDAPSFTICGEIDCFTIEGKKLGGWRYDAVREEMILYGRGSFFFGSEDGETGISYDRSTGETKVSGRLTVGSGSSGLENLSEWSGKQKEIDDAAADASAAKTTADAASAAADAAQQAADEAKQQNDALNESLTATENELRKAIEDAESDSNKYTDEAKTALQTALQKLDESKANVDDVYTKSAADGLVTNAEKNANAKAQELAAAAQLAAETTSKAYADGVADDAEKAAIADAEAKLAAAQTELDAAIKEVEDIANTANAATKTLDARISDVETGISESVAEINARLDGVVENWFEEGVPTTDNYPASEWTTDEEKANHVGDTYTNIDSYENDPDNAGKSWRWTYTDSEHTGYHWHPIADSDAVLALQKAAEAQSTADGKSRTFVTTPAPPYSVGDLWVQGSTGDIMRCKNARSSGSYTETDWELASKYTDDTTANQAKDAAAAAQEAASEAQTKADSAQSVADSAKATLSLWESDQTITKMEKSELVKEYDFVVSDYTEILIDAEMLGIVTVNLQNAAAAYLTDLEYIVYNDPPIQIPQGLRDNQEAYYDIRTAILNEIAEERMAVINAAATAATKAEKAVDDMNDDLIFSIVEKRSMRSSLKAINPSEGDAVFATLFALTSVTSSGSGSWSIVEDSSDANFGWYASDMHTASSFAIAKVQINVVTACDITVHLMSRAESSYDYTLLSAMDADVLSSLPAYNTSGIVAHTRAKQSTDVSYTFTDVSAGSHSFYVYYRKDGSGDTSPDNGYFKVDLCYAPGNLGDYAALCDARGTDYSSLVANANALFAYLYDREVWADVNTALSAGDDFRNTVYGLFQAYYAELVVVEQKIPANDYGYLANAFKDGSTEISGGLVMSEIVAVKDSDGTEIEAFLNGSDFARDTDVDPHTDETCGKLILAAGIPTETEDGSTDLEARAKEATTRIYEDGCMFSKELHLQSGCTIGDLNIYAEKIYDDEAPIGSISSGTLIDSDDNPDGVMYSGFSATGILTQGQSINGKTTRCRLGNSCNGYALGIFVGTAEYCTGHSDAGIEVHVPEDSAAIASQSGMFAGLRPKCVTLSSTTYYCDMYDHTIISNAASGTYYLYLPMSPKQGTEIRIWKNNNHVLYVRTRDSKIIIRPNVSNSTAHSIATSFYGTIDCIYDATNGTWIMVVNTNTV